GRTFRGIVWGRDAESGSTLGNCRDAGRAGALKLWLVCAAAAAMVDESRRSGAARLRGRAADGAGHGRGRGTMHRAHRVGAAADGRAERKSVLRIRPVLYARGRSGSALRRARTGGGQYPAAAAFR